MAPWLSFGLADAVPADRVAACSIALKLSRGQRDRMRAGRPRSQAMPWGVPGGRLLRKPTCTPVGTGARVDVRWCFLIYISVPSSVCQPIVILNHLQPFIVLYLPNWNRQVPAQARQSR